MTYKVKVCETRAIYMDVEAEDKYKATQIAENNYKQNDSLKEEMKKDESIIKNNIEVLN